MKKTLILLLFGAMVAFITEAKTYEKMDHGKTIESIDAEIVGFIDNTPQVIVVGPGDHREFYLAASQLAASTGISAKAIIVLAEQIQKTTESFDKIALQKIDFSKLTLEFYVKPEKFLFEDSRGELLKKQYAFKAQGKPHKGYAKSKLPLSQYDRS